MKKITADGIERIANKLRLMPAAKPQPEYSPRDAVSLLASEIDAMQQRGYSLAQIAKTLRGEGLEIDTPTLESYLRKGPLPAPAKAAPGRASSTAKRVAKEAKGAARTTAGKAKPAAVVAKVAAKKASQRATPTATRSAVTKASPRGAARTAQAPAKRGHRAMFELKPDTDDI